MNVLLTGCAGFIGARVAAMLLQRGDAVVGLDNLNDYYDFRLKRNRLDELLGDGLIFHEADIESTEVLEQILSGGKFDVIIHLAASIAQPEKYFSTNVLGTMRLLQSAVAHEIPRFVMASTSSLYAGAEMPFHEGAHVKRTLSPYAASKLSAEALAQTWHHLHGLNVCMLRYFTVYGPAGRPDMGMFKFIERIRRGIPLEIYGDGEDTRDITYIDDIARGTVMAMEISGCEVVNLGGGEKPISVLHTVELIEKNLGRKASIRHLSRNRADMEDTSASISKASSLLGWKPEVSAEIGIRRTVEWHLENAVLLDQLSVI